MISRFLRWLLSFVESEEDAPSDERRFTPATSSAIPDAPDPEHRLPVLEYRPEPTYQLEPEDLVSVPPPIGFEERK